MSFTELGLSAELLRAIDAQGYTTPTPIQKAAIPVVISGRDLMACAQTGTGKTAAFTLPILQRLTGHHEEPGHISRDTATPRVLILVPTRELAAQVEESVRTYGSHTKVRSLAMFGGVGINPQIAALRKGIDMLIATPGRLMDHMNQRTVDLRNVAVLVLDEADRMLDMGFIRDMKKIVAKLPQRRQTLLFSATFSDEIRGLAQEFLQNPESVEVARRNATVDIINQTIVHVDRDKKRELLLHLFENHGLNHALVFTRTKYGADALCSRLIKAGIRSAALHGDKTQGARVRALADFKAGKLAALVATDIAARGIDIDALPYVVNYELPNVAEDYVHRIGRTGRAGAGGEAISLVCHDERGQLRDIERLIKRDIQTRAYDGFEPGPAPKAAPKPAGNGGARNGQRSGAPGGAAKPRGGGSSGKPGGGRGRPQGQAAAGRSFGGGDRDDAPAHRSGKRHQ
jgi:ATP-dependent RNA helicase RhlE